MENMHTDFGVHRIKARPGFLVLKSNIIILDQNILNGKLLNVPKCSKYVISNVTRTHSQM